MVEATQYRYGPTGTLGRHGALVGSLSPKRRPNISSNPNTNDDASSTWIDLTAYDSHSRDEERDDVMDMPSPSSQEREASNRNSSSSPRTAPPPQDNGQKIHRILDGINDMVVRESPFSLAATLSGDDGVPIKVWDEDDVHHHHRHNNVNDSIHMERPAPVILLWDTDGAPPRPEHPVNGLSRYQKALVRLDGVRRRTAERSATVAKDTDILSSKHAQLVQQNLDFTKHSFIHNDASHHRNDNMDRDMLHMESRSAPTTPSHRLFIDTSAMEDVLDDHNRHKKGDASSVKDFMTAFSYEFKNRMPDQPIDVINIDDILMEQERASAAMTTSNTTADTTMTTTTATSTVPNRSLPRAPEHTPIRTSPRHGNTSRRHLQLATDPLAFKREYRQATRLQPPQPLPRKVAAVAPPALTSSLSSSRASTTTSPSSGVAAPTAAASTANSTPLQPQPQLPSQQQQHQQSRPTIASPSPSLQSSSSLRSTGSSSQKRTSGSIVAKRVPTKQSLDVQRNKISTIRNTVKSLQQQQQKIMAGSSSNTTTAITLSAAITNTASRSSPTEKEKAANAMQSSPSTPSLQPPSSPTLATISETAPTYLTPKPNTETNSAMGSIMAGSEWNGAAPIQGTDRSHPARTMDNASTSPPSSAVGSPSSMISSNNPPINFNNVPNSNASPRPRDASPESPVHAIVASESASASLTIQSMDIQDATESPQKTKRNKPMLDLHSDLLRKNAKKIQEAFASKLSKLERDALKVDSSDSSLNEETTQSRSLTIDTSMALLEEKQTSPIAYSTVASPSSGDVPSNPNAKLAEKPVSPQNALWIKNIQNRLAAMEKRVDTEQVEMIQTDEEVTKAFSGDFLASNEVIAVEEPTHSMVEEEIRDLATQVHEDNGWITEEADASGDKTKMNEAMTIENDERSFVPLDIAPLHDPHDIREEIFSNQQLPVSALVEGSSPRSQPDEALQTVDLIAATRMSPDATNELNHPNMSPREVNQATSDEVAVNASREIREDEALDAVFEIGSSRRSMDTTDNEQEHGTSVDVTTGTADAHSEGSAPQKRKETPAPAKGVAQITSKPASPAAKTRRESPAKIEHKKFLQSNSKKESEASGSEDNVSFGTDYSEMKVSIVDSATTDSETEEEPEMYGPCSGLPYAIQLLDVTCAWLEREENSCCFQPSLLKKVKKRDLRRNDKLSPGRPRMTSRIPQSAALSQCFGEAMQEETEKKRTRPKSKSSSRGSPSRPLGSRVRAELFEAAQDVYQQELNVINVPVDQRSRDTAEPVEVVVTPTSSNVTKKIEAQQSGDTSAFGPKEVPAQEEQSHEPNPAKEEHFEIGSSGSDHVGDVLHISPKADRNAGDVLHISPKADRNADDSLQRTREIDVATNAIELLGHVKSDIEEAIVEARPEQTSDEWEPSLTASVSRFETREIPKMDQESPISVMSDEETLKKGNQSSRIETEEAAVVRNDTTSKDPGTAELEIQRNSFAHIFGVKSAEELPSYYMSSFQQTLRAKSMSPRSQIQTASSPKRFCRGPTLFEARDENNEGFSSSLAPPMAPDLSSNDREPAPMEAFMESSPPLAEMHLVLSVDQDHGVDISHMAQSLETCPSGSASEGSGSAEEGEPASRVRSRRDCLAKLRKHLPRTGTNEGEPTTPKALSESGVSMLNDEQRQAAMDLAEKLRRRATTLTRRRKIRERRKELRGLVRSPPTSPISSQGFSDLSV